jgi:uncharacterized protein (TIGR02569 family)
VSASVNAAPQAHVRREFGADSLPERLLGGQGTSWRAGGLVFKPVADEEEARWLGRVLASVAQDGFRLAEPVATSDGRWVVEGWGAARWVAGEANPAAHWQGLLAASRAFHQALRRVPRPPFLDRRTHWWARADRSTWDETAPPSVPALRRLRADLTRFTRPVLDYSQLIHGDLSGNVLFDPSLPPAVIDVSPYWRPQHFADAIVLADALLWWNEDAALLSAAGRAGAPSWVARGLLFRLDTLGFELAETGRVPGEADLATYDRAITVLRETA